MAEKTQVDLSLLNYYKDLYSGHKIIYVRFLGEDFIFKTISIHLEINNNVKPAAGTN